VEQHHQEKKKRKNIPHKGLEDFARYSGLAFQMIAIILVTTWGGLKLDELAGFGNPVFVIVLSLLGVFAAIYFAVKEFIK